MELLFFNGLFENNYFKKHILQKTKLKSNTSKTLSVTRQNVTVPVELAGKLDG